MRLEKDAEPSARVIRAGIVGAGAIAAAIAVALPSLIQMLDTAAAVAA
jgi:hypothetical protein